MHFPSRDYRSWALAVAVTSRAMTNTITVFRFIFETSLVLMFD
jgi:hypothetical protein